MDKEVREYWEDFCAEHGIDFEDNEDDFEN